MGWKRALALFVTVSVVEGFLVSHFIAFGPFYLARLGVPQSDLPTWTGILSALPFLVGFPLVPFWGPLGDRYGRKLVLVRSALVAALVAGLAAIAPTPIAFVASFALAGFQLGNTGIMYAVQTQITPRPRVGLALGVLATSGTMGFALGPALGGPLADRIGYQALFAVDASFSLLSAVALAFCFVDPPRPSYQGSVWRHGLLASLAAVTSRESRIVFSIATLIMLARASSGAFMPLMILAAYDGVAIATVTGLVLGAAALGGVLAGPSSGAAGDRWGFGRVLPVVLLAGAAALLAVAAASGVAGLGVAFAASVALSSGASSLCIALLATRTQLHQRSTTLNLALVPLYVGGTAGPPIGAAVAQWGVPVVFVTNGAILAIASILSFRLVGQSRGGSRMSRR